MTDKTLVKVQAASGGLFMLFLTLHLVNTILAAGGHELYNGFQAAVRPVYQYPLVELGLIMAPLTVHMWAGFMRWRRRRPAAGTPGLRIRIHRWAGWFLVLVIGGHIVATRGPSLFFGVYPEFEGMTFALVWQPLIFYPYYILLGLAGLYHGANGVVYALALFQVRVPRPWTAGKRFWIPLGGAAAVLLYAVLAFGGLWGSVPEPAQHSYAKLYEKYLGVTLERGESTPAKANSGD